MSLAGFEFCLFFDRAKEARGDVTTFLNMRFITTQKAALFEKILHVIELKVKKVSLKVPNVL